jgi:hypothetical protein
MVEFNVISGNDVLIKEIVESYNNIYNTDFEIVEFIYDKVVYTKLRVNKYTISDIFRLGYQLGGFVENQRYKSENKE